MLRSSPARETSSFPDLSTITKEDGNSNSRKRKFQEDYITKGELENFAKKDQFDQILSCLEKLSLQQNEKLDAIRNDISELKNEITNIRQVTDQLRLECNDIKNDISNIKTNEINTKRRICLLEEKINLLNNQKYQLDQENLIYELQDRAQREKNIIFSGISEIQEKNLAIRSDYDKQQVMNIMAKIDEKCSQPVKIIRLGKYREGQSRKLRVSFHSADIVRRIFRNKTELGPIHVYPDQTPQQVRYLKKLREELELRIKNGETDLTIKYIKGKPIITKLDPKN